MNTSLKIIAAAILVSLTAVACSKEGKPKKQTDFSGGCEAIDLGLSVKWASYNVGAISEFGAGAFFAWGETTEKRNYGWAGTGDYLWGVYDSDEAPLYGMTGYTAAAEGGDGKAVLQKEDDPATKNWGTRWRTPTIEEIKELCDKEKCEWTWDSARKGYTITGKANGKSIFLPASGSHIGSKLEQEGLYGSYWSSSVDESRVQMANHLRFDAGLHSWSSGYRSYGMSVRAVTRF